MGFHNPTMFLRVFFCLFSISAALNVKGSLKSKTSASPSCTGIQCGALSCPSGFNELLPEGGCCPICFDPDHKVAKGPTGATGDHGGATSEFCSDVWCFPLMCPSEEKMQSANLANGQCCTICKV